MRKLIVVCLGLLVAFMGVVLPAGSSFAGENNPGHTSQPKHDEGDHHQSSKYPYEVSVWWQVDNYNGTSDWPQTRVGGVASNPTCDTTRYQFDKYWIRDSTDESYLQHLQHLRSSADDAQLEPHDYVLKSVAGTGTDYNSTQPGCGTPPVVVPQKPNPVVSHKYDSSKNCATKVVTVVETTTTQGWVLENNKWVAATPVVTTDSHSRAATETECPTPVVPPVKVPPVLKHAATHVKVIDRCSCKHDSVSVTGAHISTKVSQHKNTWTIRVTADTGYLVPLHIGGSHYVKSTVYTVHTTNKPCPCTHSHTCHPKHHAVKHHKHHVVKHHHAKAHKPACGCKR